MTARNGNPPEKGLKRSVRVPRVFDIPARNGNPPEKGLKPSFSISNNYTKSRPKRKSTRKRIETIGEVFRVTVTEMPETEIHQKKD